MREHFGVAAARGHVGEADASATLARDAGARERRGDHDALARASRSGCRASRSSGSGRASRRTHVVVDAIEPRQVDHRRADALAARARRPRATRSSAAAGRSRRARRRAPGAQRHAAADLAARYDAGSAYGRSSGTLTKPEIRAARRSPPRPSECASRASRSLHGSIAIRPGHRSDRRDVAHRLMRVAGTARHDAARASPYR